MRPGLQAEHTIGPSLGFFQDREDPVFFHGAANGPVLLRLGPQRNEMRSARLAHEIAKADFHMENVFFGVGTVNGNYAAFGQGQKPGT